MHRKEGSPPESCSAPGCSRPATVRVFLNDYYGHGIDFHEVDFSCPYLCDEHMKQNEAEATGFRRECKYPFTKWGGKRAVEGWTTYENID